MGRRERRKAQGMSERLVKWCDDCPRADRKSKTCTVLVAPTWQWREGRYCWGRELAEGEQA